MVLPTAHRASIAPSSAHHPAQAQPRSAHSHHISYSIMCAHIGHTTRRVRYTCTRTYKCECQSNVSNRAGELPGPGSCHRGHFQLKCRCNGRTLFSFDCATSSLRRMSINMDAAGSFRYRAQRRHTSRKIEQRGHARIKTNITVRLFSRRRRRNSPPPFNRVDFILSQYI